jgi:hypothetical protein
MPLAGQRVTQSGIYRASHAGHDDFDGDVVLVRGERFPRCPECNYGIYYTLVHAAPSAAEVRDFDPGAKPKASAA